MAPRIGQHHRKVQEERVLELRSNRNSLETTLWKSRISGRTYRCLTSHSLWPASKTRLIRRRLLKQENTRGAVPRIGKHKRRGSRNRKTQEERLLEQEIARAASLRPSRSLASLGASGSLQQEPLLVLLNFCSPLCRGQTKSLSTVRPNLRPTVRPNLRPTVKPSLRPTLRENLRQRSISVTFHSNLRQNFRQGSVQISVQRSVQILAQRSVQISAQRSVQISAQRLVSPNLHPVVRPNL